MERERERALVGSNDKLSSLYLSGKSHDIVGCRNVCRKNLLQNMLVERRIITLNWAGFAACQFLCHDRTHPPRIPREAQSKFDFRFDLLASIHVYSKFYL